MVGRFLSAISQRRIPHVVIAVPVVVALLSWIQFGTRSICCGDFDGYYHIKQSRLLWDGLRSGDFPPVFSSLPLTTLSPRTYADQHFLFHLLLIPFTWAHNLALSAKLAAILFATLAVLSCYWLVFRYRVRYAAIWLLALLGCSSEFLYRISMTRAQSLSIVFIVAGIFLLFERRYLWLAPTAFLYVWAYNLFVLLIFMAIVWLLVAWWAEGRHEWGAPVYAGAGAVGGLIINPYFPRNAKLLVEHIFLKSGQVSIQPGVGIEWYSLSSWILLKTCLIAFIAMVVGYLTVGYLLAGRERSRVQRPLFLAVFASFLLIMTARSVRFTEYWPPFAVLFAAFALQAVWEGQTAREITPTDSFSLKQSHDRKTALHIAAVATVTVALIGILAHTARLAYLGIANNVGSDQYQGGAQWLNRHVPAGTMIFNVHWGDFPKLFFYDDSHNYVSGLDPSYLSHHDPELGHLYDRIINGQEQDSAALIRSRFRAEYIFVGAVVNPTFYRQMEESEHFEKAYEDNQCIVLRIK
jgi:hypothetical protein